MDFNNDAHRQMFIDDVRSCMSFQYRTPSGVQLSGCPETVLMKTLRGYNPPGCRGDKFRHSELQSGRMWRIPSRPADFISLMRSVGFRSVQAHPEYVGRRRGALCCLVTEKQS